MNKNAKILAVAGILAALVGCAGEAPEAASVAPSLDIVDDNVAGQGAPAIEAPEASDPFAGDMPDFMVDAMVQRLDGELLDLSLQRALFEHAQDNPEDARPWLLLAGDSMDREFYGIAARQYGSALGADAGIRHLPGVLVDLQTVIESGDAGARRDASELVAKHWGEERLPPAAVE